MLDTCQAHGPCSILALDKTAMDKALLEFDAFDLLARNTKELARVARLESAKSKFKRAVQRLRTSTMLKGMAAAASAVSSRRLVVPFKKRKNSAKVPHRTPHIGFFCRCYFVGGQH